MNYDILIGAFIFLAGYLTCYFFIRKEIMKILDSNKIIENELTKLTNNTQDVKERIEELEFISYENNYTHVKRVKPSFKSALKPFEVSYEKYQNKAGFFEPRVPKRGD